MNLWPLRELVLDLNLLAHGVAAIVTRPAPNNTPINTTGIWGLPLEEGPPYGAAIKRREPRRVFYIPREDVPTLPNGTTVQAPESTGGTPVNWKVDGYLEAVRPGFWSALLVQ
jgi:hypothetical protein